MKSVLLIGLGLFGKHIAKKLNELNHEVMAVDKCEEKVNEILPYVTNAQIGDSTNKSFLKTLGVDEYDVCFVAISNDFQSSLETTSLLKELGAKLVISRAERGVQAKFLLRNGADDIVYPEKQVASWAAVKYTADHILDFIEIDENYSMYEINIPKGWLGKTIAELDIRKRHGVNIMAVKESGKMNVSVSPDMVLREDATILVMGDNKAIDKMLKIK